MKPTATVPPAAPSPVARRRRTSPPAHRIHPVVMYPFRPSADYRDLDELYGLVGRLASQPDVYARPITVVDRKTHHRLASDAAYRAFRTGTVDRCSDVLDAWCVDTCQMWYAGLGAAYERGAPGDVYWLIPGDFDYGKPEGREVLGRLHDLPEICVELGQDVCIGEIAMDHKHPKQLIDTYGTFALLYHWFPAETREIREYTQRPRSEFFAVRHEFLAELLNQRWFAYEQTVVVLLQAVLNRKRIAQFSVGDLSDLPEGRESLAAAMQQVERTERVLKTVWRERHQETPDWSRQYRLLEGQSEQIRRTAMTLLENLLA